MRGFPPARSQISFLSACLAVLFAISPHGALAQDLSASDLLKKISEAYRRVSSFSVVAEERIELESDTSGERIYDRTRSGAHVHGGFYTSGDIQVTLMTSSSSKAKLLLKQGKKTLVVVCDGKLLWTLIPAQHVYTEVVAAESANIQRPVYLPFGSNDISGMDLLREYEHLVAARFQSTPRYLPWAKLGRSRTLKWGKEKRECYVLTLRMPSGARKQKLWVDKTEFTVWKSVYTTVGPWDEPGETLQTKVTVTVKQMTLNPPLDDSNFVFAPPNQAKKLDSLKLSGGIPFYGWDTISGIFFPLGPGPQW